MARGPEQRSKQSECHRWHRLDSLQHGQHAFRSQKMEESKAYHEKHIQIKPTDPEPYYWIGVIDWSIAFR